MDNNIYSLKSPDGYAFFVVDDDAEGIGKKEKKKYLVESTSMTNTFTFSDPVKKVTLNTNDLDKTQHYWQDILKMKIVSKTDLEVTLAYDVTSTHLGFKKIGMQITRINKNITNFIGYFSFI